MRVRSRTHASRTSRRCRDHLARLSYDSSELPARVCEHMFVSRDATILHADLDAFYASVEQRDDPRLRGRPVIVGAGVVLAASYEAKAYGVRTAMGGAQARRLCPRAIVVEPRFSAYVEASKAVFRVFERHDAAGRRAVDRRGVPRRPRARADLGLAHRDRRAIAARRPRAGRPAHHGRGREDEVPRQGGERRGQARRSARRAARRRAGLSPPAAGRAALGRRAGHGRQAPRPGNPDGRRGGPARRGGAGLDARAGGGPPPPRARPQPRSPAGAGRPSPRLDRVAARARSFTAIARGHRRRRRRPGRPRHPPDARRRPGRPHGRAPAALRRLLASDSFAHAAPGDRTHPDDPRHGERAARDAPCR